MGWDIDVREKIYLRLANEIFFRILHGEYAQGEKLPSYAELAKKAGCSPETVRKAIRELQQQGVVENLRVGYRKIITYTLDTEPGTSLRAAGWACAGLAGGERWTGQRRPAVDLYPPQKKLRYEKEL